MSGDLRQVPAVMVSQPSGPGPHPGGHAIPEHPPTQQQPQPQQHQHQHQHQQQHQQHNPSQSQNQNQQQSQQQQQQQADMAVKLTRGTSCVLCQQRKVRCDKNKPCANCVKARVECRVVPPQPPRRRKKRLQEKDLVERLKKYEVLLSENNIKFESIAADLPGAGGGGAGGGGGGRDRARSGSAAGGSAAGGGDLDGTEEGMEEEGMDEVTELENDFEGLRTSAGSSTSPSVGSGRRSQTEKPFKWMPFHKEFRASEQLLQDSSDDEVDGSTIHNAFDKMYQNQDGFPFIVGARNAPVTHLHPPPIHIFQLWQIYINRINPLLRMTHVPTVQGQVIEASAKLEKVSQSLEALMFGIYLMAVISLEDGEAQKTFGEPKTELVSKYYSAVQQALINAGFMRSNEISVLQAYTLYLIAARQFMDPRQIFCLSSIAVRIGQRMGLHRDPALFGHSPYEVEQRRRLWWTIVAYDVRIGEMTGSTVTALSTPSDCRLPLNINDTELHVDGKDSPTPHQGPTEMLFCLSRLELCLAVRNDPSRDVPTAIGPNAGSPPTSSPPGAGSTPGSALATNAAAMTSAAASASAAGASGQPARPIPTVRIANQENLSYTLDGFAAHIEAQYLRHCDEKIPLHFFTLTMTRQALCKMRIIAFLVRMGQGDDNPLNEAERETLFLEAVQMIEYDNVLQSAESLRYYKWYTYMHFPFPAYMFLVTELRHRTTGPMVERAWVAVSENHERRRIMNKIHNPMHLAFGRLFVKAWDAHELGERAVGKVLREPEWIERLRVHAERSKSRSTEPEGGMMGGMGFMGGGGPGGPLGGLGGFGRGMGMGMGMGMGGAGIGPGMTMAGDGGGAGRFGGMVGAVQDEQRTPTRHHHASEESVVVSPVVDVGQVRKSLGSRTPQQQQQQQQQRGGAEYGDMDWSYIMQEYNMSGASGLGGQGGGPSAGSSNMY